MAGPSLPDRIAQCYYTHGLFCSSHPIIAISIAICCFLLCCYPLLNIPIPGSIPLKIHLPYRHQDVQKPFNDPIYSFVQSNSSIFENQLNVSQDIDQSNSTISLSVLMNETANLPYLWAKDQPLLYVQQIILKTGVWPWRDELKLGDAFRAPLQEVFRLLETIRNHQQLETGTSLGQVCFHVENVKRNIATHKASPVLPEYSCLVLSPANIWQQSIERFLLDANILSTVFNHQNLQKGKVSTAEMVFGMHLKDTGIKRYPLRARPRALQYAVTLFFHELNEKYIDSLKEKLLSVYPLHHKWDKSQINNQIMLIYYPGEFNYREFIPLCMVFIGLFIYVYFSVRKLEFVRSKLGLAISAVVSVAASLIMTLGFCFFFGLTLSFQGKEIFPYLVILVGVENVFVLTKSVMSTDFKLDVKIRLAQGLSKEGWSITKNLLVEITILTISLFTFVPVIQQFSIFMIVSLLCDFFLQMVFFTTVLGIDIRRKEESREKSNEFQLNQRINANQGKLFVHDFSGFNKINTENYTNVNTNIHSPTAKITKSKSHPRLNGLACQTHTNVVANLYNYSNQQVGKSDKKVPKRIRLVKIWARTRFFQRAFMIWMVVWISMIIYNSGIIENLFDISDSSEDKSDQSITSSHNKFDLKSTFNSTEKLLNEKLEDYLTSVNDKSFGSKTTHSSLELEELAKTTSELNNESLFNKADLENMEFNAEILNKTPHFISLKHLTYPHPWSRLSEFHWSSVLAQYNVSVSGRYLSVLPPILVKHRVTPEKAAALRNPAEKDNITPPSRWRALVAALDPLDLTDFEIDESIHIPHVQLQPNFGISQSPNDIPYYPTSPMEIGLLLILCLISALVIAYAMVVLYRCVCTKNYAEWRSSWRKLDKDNQFKKPALQFVMEAVPTVVAGHNHEIECLATNGESIVSCCLQGQLKIWDPSNGDLITNIDRHMFFRLHNNMSERLNQKSIKFDYGSSDDSDSSSNNTSFNNSRNLRKRGSSKQSRPLSEINTSNISHPSYDENYLDQRILTSSKLNDPIKVVNNSTDEYYQVIEENSAPLHNMEYVDLVINECKNCEGKNCDSKINSHDHLKTHSSEIDNNNPLISDHNHPIPINYDPRNESFKTNKFKCQLSPNFPKKSVINKSISLEKLVKPNLIDFDDKINDDSLSLIPDSSFPPSIWCMDFADDLIALGCSDGRVEFWEASTGKFKCIFDDKDSASVSFVRLLERMSSNDMHLVVARLSGHLDLLSVEGPPPTQNSYKRTHIRTGSDGSILLREESGNKYNQDQYYKQPYNLSSSHRNRDPFANESYLCNSAENGLKGLGEQLHCRRLTKAKAHQQPITGLECDGGKIITGSQDHTLKVFSSYDLTPLYTLHGHCGPITCLFIDRICPVVSGSGSEDGLLCVWDLVTGACVYSIQAHDGAISELVYSESYVISMGADEKLCIWDRFRGHLLNSMHIGPGAGNCGMLTLTHMLVITGGRGGLTVWDASTGEAVRKVILGPSDGCVFVRKILPLKDAIVCDYANELRIVCFPMVTQIDEQYERKND